MFRTAILFLAGIGCSKTITGTTAPTAPSSQTIDHVESMETFRELVAMRQKVLHEGDWAGFAKLLHPDAHQTILGGFRDDEALVEEIQEVYAPFRAEMGIASRSIFSSTATVRAVYPEGAIRHVVVDTGGEMPGVVTLVRLGEDWRLALPPAMSAHHLDQILESPTGTPPGLSEEVVTAFVDYSSNVEKLDSFRFSEFVSGLHSTGLARIHQELEAMAANATSEDAHQWASAFAAMQPKAFSRQVYEHAYANYPSSTVTRTLLGGLQFEDAILIVFRTRHEANGARISVLEKRLLRREDGKWKEDVGASLEAGEGHFASIFRAARREERTVAHSNAEVVCLPTSRFLVNLDGEPLLCQEDLRGAMYTEGVIHILLTGPAKARVLERTSDAVGSHLETYFDNVLFSRATLQRPLYGRALQFELPEDWEPERAEEVASWLAP